MKIDIGLYGARESSKELGRFASELTDALREHDQCGVTLLDTESAPETLDCIIYASRTRSKLVEAAEICRNLGVPLYVLSSDMEDEITAIELMCKVVRVANTSLEVQEFMRDVTNFYQAHRDWSLAITEYHQESKKDISGTALQLVRTLGLKEDCITSVRNNREAAELFAIPEMYLGGYAVHQVKFTSAKTHSYRLFEIIVLGRKTYVDGLLQLLQKDFQK